MSKRFLITIFTLLFIVVAGGIAIYLAKGYTFNVKDKTIAGTGIITITSVPDAASVYLDGHLTTATNATISSLSPAEYTVKVVKEGFIPWEKKVKVNVGLVTDLKVTLFPAIPTVYPLTFTGVDKPILSPDGGKLAYIVPKNATDSGANKKAGVWVWSMTSDKPIAFARGAEPHQIADNRSIDYSTAILKWSSDSTQVLANIGNNNYLLQDSQLNTDPRDITPTLTATLKSWEDDLKVSQSARFLNIKNLAKRQEASNAGVIRWSPDETKIMYAGNKTSAQPDKTNNTKADSQTTQAAEDSLSFKVYDILTNLEYEIPQAKYHYWLPDSRHLVLVDEGAIAVADFDGTNKAIIYVGNFDVGSVFIWPDSSRLAIVSSIPTPTASAPNLYGINLK